MDIKAYLLRKFSSQIPNRSIKENVVQREICDANANRQEPFFPASSFSPICMTNPALGTSPGFQDSSSQCPTFDYCMTARIGCNKLRIGNACDREFFNGQLVQREICDANARQQVPCFPASSYSPICMTNPALGMSPGFQDSSSQFPTFDCFVTPRIGPNTLRTINACERDFFEGSLRNGYNLLLGTTVVDCEGKNKLSPPEGVIQIASKMVPSHERISSNKALPRQYWNYDNGPFNGGPTLPGSNLQYIPEKSSENYIQQRCHGQDMLSNYAGELNYSHYRGFMENAHNVCDVGFPSPWEQKLEFPYSNLQNSQQGTRWIPQASDALNNLIDNPPRSKIEDLLQSQLLMPRSQEFRQWHHQPYVQLDKPSEAQSCLVEDKKCCNETAGQEASKLPELHSEQSLGITSELYQGSRKPNNGLKRAFSGRDLSDTKSGIKEDVLPPSKCLKTENFDSFESAVCHEVDPAINQPYASEQLSRLMQRHETPVAHSSVVMKVDTELLIPIQGPTRTSVTWNDASDTPQSLDFKSTPIPAEVFIGGCRHGEIECTCISEKRNAVGEICHSKEPLDSHKEEEIQVRTMSNQAGPVADSSVVMEVDTELLTPIQGPTRTSVTWNDASDTAQSLDFKSTPIPAEEFIGGCRHGEIERTCISEKRNAVAESCHLEKPLDSHEEEEIQVRTMSDQASPETKGDLIAPAADNESAKKSEEPNIPVVSFADFLTAEQIKEHISSLRQWNNQYCDAFHLKPSIMKEASENTIAHSVGEGSCQLCAMGKLVFAPAPKYCSTCSARIKPNLFYYHGLDEKGTQHCFCPSCFRESRGGSISFQGVSISKANLYKSCNNEENEESWVQCNKCEQWQHQICGLYNKKQDLEGKAEYLCPKCHLEETEIGEQMPLSKTTAFGAKNLRKTRLSDHIEQRLFRRLKQDREERAKALGKNFDEVPEAADLIVRVVLSVKKQLKVKQQFLDIFQDENYPAEFPYRSKVILLFQKIQGVDVCLFVMYVQEFGSECCPPNQRCVYISYLDSVKYFIPEIDSVNGEALRTFVYHEILIGYLEYCKKRGFATCYIWACPPLKGEDYILYCHPETQRTPKADKLRRWYKSMLKKATNENIVVDTTNLYDEFFFSTGESRTKITAARLPYFDGDYWSTAAENVIRKIEEESGGDLQRKVKKLTTKRNLKAMGHTNPSGDAVKDILLMHKLGQTILPLKEDFIMVSLQYTCTCCHEVILTGSRWICNQCKKVQLCERCHAVKQNVNEDGTHTSQSGERHLLFQVVVDDVPADTEDNDLSFDNDFFEIRNTFLNFCQENNYQFDTLRHAKHSSLMILYHLRNLIAPSSGTSCSICHKDIMVNQGWHCETCPEFDVCAACYQTKCGECCVHHKLARRPAAANCESNSKQAQPQRVKFNEILDVIPHTAQCHVTQSNPCSYPMCRIIKGSLRHASQCSHFGGAGHCKPCHLTKMILEVHSKFCRDSDYRVPLCRPLKSKLENFNFSLKLREGLLRLFGKHPRLLELVDCPSV
ncbi:histone acetyltransferase HAC1-like [Cornus florida]|uniref:histone acetyltransferase HAC1-like n=1 Tax=Cornus florida TaxID=4283 RepID=UPI00289BA32A|nr:histone acetyltransferase HAC1-like [Cornus florida]